MSYDRYMSGIRKISSYRKHTHRLHQIYTSRLDFPYCCCKGPTQAIPTPTPRPPPATTLIPLWGLLPRRTPFRASIMPDPSPGVCCSCGGASPCVMAMQLGPVHYAGVQTCQAGIAAPRDRRAGRPRAGPAGPVARAAGRRPNDILLGLGGTQWEPLLRPEGPSRSR